jgi:hypothetical protein
VVVGACVVVVGACVVVVGACVVVVGACVVVVGACVVVVVVTPGQKKLMIVASLPRAAVLPAPLPPLPSSWQPIHVVDAVTGLPAVAHFSMTDRATVEVANASFAHSPAANRAAYTTVLECFFSLIIIEPPKASDDVIPVTARTAPSL